MHLGETPDCWEVREFRDVHVDGIYGLFVDGVNFRDSGVRRQPWPGYNAVIQSEFPVDNGVGLERVRAGCSRRPAEAK